jgi:FAD binding domain
MRPVAEIMLMDSYYPGWLVFVDDGGHRFVNEQAAYSVVESTFQARDGRAWATFDDAAKRAAVPCSTAAAKKYDMPTGSNWEDWVEPVIDEMAAKGIVLVAGTVRELAESVGPPPRALEGELGRYNEDVLAGEDTQFGKSPVVMRTVAEPPFYATQMRLCNVSLTACGPRVDAASRVLDEGSQAIPGLYAAGSARAACSATSTWAAATRWRTRSRSAGSPGRPPRPARSSPGSGP